LFLVFNEGITYVFRHEQELADPVSKKDERRRPKWDDPAADIGYKKLNYLPAPPCLGEALIRVTLINFFDFP